MPRSFPTPDRPPSRPDPLDQRHPAREAAARARSIARIARHLAAGRLAPTTRHLELVAALAEAGARWATVAEDQESAR